MHVLTRTSLQTVLTDRLQEFLDRAVEQLTRRFDRVEPEIDIDRVSLAGSNSQLIVADCESLLVVTSNDSFQKFPRDRATCATRCCQKFIDGDPTLPIQLQTDRLGPMSEHQAQELACADQASIHNVFHSVISGGKSRDQLVNHLTTELRELLESAAVEVRQLVVVQSQAIAEA